MIPIHKAYEATINEYPAPRKVYYEILARKDCWYIFYYNYIIFQEYNDATPEENFEIAKNKLFSQPDRTFVEIEVKKWGGH